MRSMGFYAHFAGHCVRPHAYPCGTHTWRTLTETGALPRDDWMFAEL